MTIRLRLLALLVALSLATGAAVPVPAAATSIVAESGVTVDAALGNGIATGAVSDPDPAHARVTVTNQYHFWAGLDLQPPTGGAKLAPTALGEDARGLYGLLGLIGPDATSAWAGTFDPAGGSAGVWVHYDLATARGAQALALTCLTIVADTFGTPLLARSQATVVHAITLVTDLGEFTDLLGAVQRNNPFEIAKAWSLLLESQAGRGAIKLALSELGVIATDAGLKSLGTLAGAWDFVQTMRDLLLAGIGGHTSGVVTFGVAGGAAAGPAGATPTPAPAQSPTATTVTPPPTPSPRAERAISVAAGEWHSCALLSTGGVTCWGTNNSGALGTGSWDGTFTDISPAPVAVQGLRTARSIASGGGDTTCVMLTDQTIRCWGANERGQLGNGSTKMSPSPVAVVGIHSAVSLAVGGSHACAALSDGAVRCWGENALGELGDGTTTGRLSPVPVIVLGAVSAVAVGDAHTCALLADQTVACWGSNFEGELGDGTTTGRLLPVRVDGIREAVAIAANTETTCALLASGGVACWGGNGGGQLGDGTLISRSQPVAVSGLTSAVALAVGGGHACAVIRDGTVRCWGDNSYGQLGDGSTTARVTPSTVPGISSAIAISAGEAHICVVRSDGAVLCWGENDAGQLGDGTTTNRNTPVLVAGP